MCWGGSTGKFEYCQDFRDFLPIMRVITKGQNRPVVKTRRGRFSLNGVFDEREGLQVISDLASLLDMRLCKWFETLQVLEERKRKRLKAFKIMVKAKTKKVRKRQAKIDAAAERKRSNKCQILRKEISPREILDTFQGLSMEALYGMQYNGARGNF